MEIINGLLEVLYYLEQRDVVHGSLSPESVILFGGSKVVLINFGYSVELVRNTMSIPKYQKERPVSKYVPPEIEEGLLTATSDVFSFGVMVNDMVEAVKNPSDIEKEYISIITSFIGPLQKANPAERTSLGDVVAYFRNRTFYKKVVTIP